MSFDDDDDVTIEFIKQTIVLTVKSQNTTFDAAIMWEMFKTMKRVLESDPTDPKFDYKRDYKNNPGQYYLTLITLLEERGVPDNYGKLVIKGITHANEEVETYLNELPTHKDHLVAAHAFKTLTKKECIDLNNQLNDLNKLMKTKKCPTHHNGGKKRRLKNKTNKRGKTNKRHRKKSKRHHKKTKRHRKKTKRH